MYIRCCDFKHAARTVQIIGSSRFFDLCLFFRPFATTKRRTSTTSSTSQPRGPSESHKKSTTATNNNKTNHPKYSYLAGLKKTPRHPGACSKKALPQLKLIWQQVLLITSQHAIMADAAWADFLEFQNARSLSLRNTWTGAFEGVLGNDLEAESLHGQSFHGRRTAYVVECVGS